MGKGTQKNKVWGVEGGATIIQPNQRSTGRWYLSTVGQSSPGGRQGRKKGEGKGEGGRHNTLGKALGAEERGQGAGGVGGRVCVLGAREGLGNTGSRHQQWAGEGGNKWGRVREGNKGVLLPPRGREECLHWVGSLQGKVG